MATASGAANALEATIWFFAGLAILLGVLFVLALGLSFGHRIARRRQLAVLELISRGEGLQGLAERHGDDPHRRDEALFGLTVGDAAVEPALRELLRGNPGSGGTPYAPPPPAVSL